MHPMPICRALVCLLALSLAPLAMAAPPVPDADLAAELCALALTNRPVDQLQSRAGCTVLQTKPFPKGSPVRRALVVRLPLARGLRDVLMFELTANKGMKPTWQDLGEVAGDDRYTAPGTLLGFRNQVTLERLGLRTTRAGPVLEVAMSRTRETDDAEGVIEARAHDVMYCRHAGELVCVQVIARSTVTVRGKVPDITPYSWTREVTLDAAGDIVVGPLQGSGELGGFDVGPGVQTIASLATRPFVRRYPVVSTAHPDALTDPDPLLPDAP